MLSRCVVDNLGIRMPFFWVKPSNLAEDSGEVVPIPTF